MSELDPNIFTIGILSREKLKRSSDLSKAMQEYEEKFGAGSLKRFTTCGLYLDGVGLAKLYRDCIKAGKEAPEYIGQRPYSGGYEI